MDWRCFFILLLVIGLINFGHCELFPTPQFSGEDVTAKVFGDGRFSKQVFPVAYGDFNADKLTDVIAVTSNRSSIVLFFAYEEPPFLRPGRICDIVVEDNKEHVEIVGAAPGDFTGDGVMDLLVTLTHGGQSNKEIIIFEGNSSDLICANHMLDTILMADEPLLVDLNGDMVMDLVGEVKAHDFNNDDRTRKIWIFSDDPGKKLQPKSMDFKIENPNRKEMRKMANPSSNAFVDINGDSVPELVILTQETPQYSNSQINYYRESYKVNQHSDIIKITFTLSEEMLINEKPRTQVYGQPIFVDLNQEGKLLHLLPFCADKDCSGSLASDKQGIKVIVNSTDIYDLPIGPSVFDSTEWGFVDPPANELEGSKWNKHFYSKSIVLRVGDYNLDGFPDLIGVLEAKGVRKNAAPVDRRAVIFENVPCKDTDQKKCTFPRTFNPNFNVLGKYSNVTLATFFDIHEDGLIDVLIVRKADNATKDGHSKYEVGAFQNSPDYDSNFMKVMVLTGRKCPTCPKLGIPYGNVIPGPVISYRTKTQTGEVQTAVAAQNYRSANIPMDLPYTIFGIGHSPNFVETLKIALSSSETEVRSHEWPQIIPNSQIIVIPSPLEDPRHWKAKLFLTPSDAVLQTFGVLVAICLVVFCIVVGLQIKEVRQDRRDRLQESHRFMM